jgi:hypothetical protein
MTTEGPLAKSYNLTINNRAFPNHFDLTYNDSCKVHFTISDILGKLAPDPPFMIESVAGILKSSSTRNEITNFNEFESDMELTCTYDPKIVMKTLIEKSSKIEIVRQCLWTIAYIRGTSSVRKKLSNCGAIEAVTKFANKYKDDEQLVESAMISLEALIIDSPGNALKAGTVGAAVVIVNSIRNFPSNSFIIRAALWTLSILTLKLEYFGSAHVSEWIPEFVKVVNIIVIDHYIPFKISN